MLGRFLRKWYLKQSGKERISPNDWVKSETIRFYPEGEGGKLVITNLGQGVKVFGVADTGSMDGLMDYGHNVILTNSFDKSRLAVGDIVAFQVYANLVLHRIVEVRWSNGGWRYRTRGDNCIDLDPYELGEDNIKYLCIGIIY